MMHQRRLINQTPICGIYQIINKLNGKVYIGQSIDIEVRWRNHQLGKGSLILFNAIKKYGVENFELEILEIVDTIKYNKLDLRNILTEKEQKWFDIKIPYNKDKGYNINSVAKVNLSKKGPNFGMKISRIRLDNNYLGKKVCQYDLNGTLIKEWKSAAEICRTLGFNTENISACCTRKSKTSNGFIWRFKNDTLTELDIFNSKRNRKEKKIDQYSLKGKFIKTWSSATEIGKVLGYNPSSISACCLNRIKTSNSFIWVYHNCSVNNIDLSRKKAITRQVKQITQDNQIVKIWVNLKQIKTLLNFDTRPIKNCCNKKQSSYKGFKWEWA